MTAENRAGCKCAAWKDRVRINLGAATVDLLHEEFDVLRDRNPWLHLARCKGCGQHWYAAVDTVDDDYYFRRLPAAEVAHYGAGRVARGLRRVRQRLADARGRELPGVPPLAVEG